MAGTMLKSWAVAGSVTLLLAGCLGITGGAPTTDGATDAAAAPATSVRLVDTDVEAPEVFQTTDKGLWDGRPSLGGVWVASPNAKNPERVIMRNPANGKFVIGGLFQRDASLPGPKLQLSSDAADALGLLAGEPAVISVTALRRDDGAKPAPDATKPLLDANEPAATDMATTDTATTDTATTDTGALDSTAADTSATTASKAGAPTTKPAAKPAPTAAKPAAPAAQTSSGVIQVGIFSVEANARRAADVLTKAGIAVATTPETSHGKPLWSVTAHGDAALLAKIKAAGFKDAYAQKR
jgi:hypothetical protein